MRKHMRIFACAIAAAVAVAAAVTLICGGLNLNVDFSGGYLLKYDINQDFEISDLEKIVSQQGSGDYLVLKAGEKMDQAIIRVQYARDEGAAITAAVQEQYPGAKFRGCDSATRALPRMTLLFFALAGLVAAVAASLYLAARYGVSGGVGAFASCMGTMLLLLALVLIARISINPGLLAAFLAVLLYSLLDVGVYFEQMRAALRKGAGEELLEAAKASAGACRLQRILVAAVGAVMFLLAYLLGNRLLLGFGVCTLMGVALSALCSTFLGIPVSAWAKQRFGKGRKVRKKVKAIR